MAIIVMSERLVLHRELAQKEITYTNDWCISFADIEQWLIECEKLGATHLKINPEVYDHSVDGMSLIAYYEHTETEEEAQQRISHNEKARKEHEAKRFLYRQRILKP